MKQDVQHFARAHNMSLLIQAAKALPPELMHAAMAAISPYESRGKGRNKSLIHSWFTRSGCGMRQNVHNHFELPSGYGEQECARRVRQILQT